MRPLCHSPVSTASLFLLRDKPQPRSLPLSRYSSLSRPLPALGLHGVCVLSTPIQTPPHATRMLGALQRHFNRLAEYAAKYQLCAILSYHFKVHCNLVSQAYFDPNNWYKQIDPLVTPTHLSVDTCRLGPSSSTLAGPSGTSRKQSYSAASKPSLKVCKMFQSGKCKGTVCRFTCFHQCLSCGRSHPHCKGKKKVNPVRLEGKDK